MQKRQGAMVNAAPLRFKVGLAEQADDLMDQLALGCSWP
jgi:hypothetical protein